MLAFKLNKSHRFLDLRKDASVTLTTTNALTDPDNVNRTYSFDFDLPRSPNNDHEFEHIHQLDSAATEGVDIEMIIAGISFTEGTLDVTDISPRNYRAAFKSANRQILDELSYELSTFAQETVNYITTPIDNNNRPDHERYKLKFINLNPDANTLHHLYFGNRHWTMGILPGQTTTQAAITFAANINALLGSRRGVPAAEADGEYLIINAWYNIRSEPRSLVYNLIIQPGDNFEIIEMSTEQTFIQQHNIDQIHLNSQSFEHAAFPCISMPNAAVLSKFLGVINAVDASTGKLFPNTFQTEKVSENILVPMIRLKYVLRKIANRLNLIPSGDFWDSSEMNHIVFFNTIALDNFVEYDSPSGKQYLNVFQTSFSPGNHLPKMTAKELLQEIGKMFGVKISVKYGHLIFDFKKDAYNAIPQNFTAQLIPDSLKFQKRNKVGVTLSYPTDTNIIVPTTQLISYKTTSTANEYKEYQLGFTTLPMSADSVFEKQDVWRRISVRMPIYHGKMGEIPKTLILSRGLITVLNLKYTYATHDTINPNPLSTDEFYTWSLTPQKLYEIFLRNIIELEAAPSVEADFNLTADEIIAFERGDYSRIIAYTPRGFLSGVIKQIRVKISTQNIGVASIEILRI